MDVTVTPAPPDAIRAMRKSYRKTMACQIVHDSWHERGFTQSYLISVHGTVVGYGSVGGVGTEPRDTVKEFFILPGTVTPPDRMFRALVAASGARRIEAQTNDALLTLMLFDFVDHIERDRILFRDSFTTSHAAPGVVFRRVEEDDRARIFAHEVEPTGDWCLEVAGEIVATGGLMFHYNPPYSDVYMEVGASWRRRGYGTYLVQELKRTSYEAGRIPAARCDASNTASRATLQNAGMMPTAWIVNGVIAG